jgi:large subunit ribosomal protein L7/L12
LVSETANCNYVEAKKLIEKAPVEIFCGKAVEVKTIKEKLEAANIEIRIEPEFPY